MSLPKPTKEGETTTCPKCDAPLIARLKTYKDDMYPAYIQWQNESETKAHLDSGGNCTVPTIPIPTRESVLLDKDKSISKIPEFEETTKNIIKSETLILLQLNNTILNYLKTMIVDPNHAMVGQFTKILYDKYFLKEIKN